MAFLTLSRRYIPAIVWGVAIFLLEAFAIIMYRSLLSESVLYVAVVVAGAAAALISLAIYISEPKFRKTTYHIRVTVIDSTAEDSLGRAILETAMREGRITPSKLAEELGVTVYKIVERLYDLEKEGKIRIEGIEAET